VTGRSTLSAQCLLFATVATSAFAGPAPADVRVSAEHRLIQGETSEAAKQLALAEAERQAVSMAAAQLRDLAATKALKLTPNQLEALLFATLDVQDHSNGRLTRGNPATYQVDVRIALNADETIRRLGRLRRDQEALGQLERTWKEMQESSATPESRQLKRLVIQITTALARTEEAPVGGRTPSKAGRERARQLADQALALSPDSPDAHSAMGDVLIDARELETAEAEYRKAFSGNPGNSGSALLHGKLGNALLLQSKFGDAQAELRESIRLDATAAQAHADLGLVLSSERKTTEAVSEYREAVRIDPALVEAHNGLAVTLARMGRMDDAIAEFREIVRVDPDSAIGYYNLSYALADMDKDEESADAIREVLRINPDHYNAHYNLGELFRLEGKYDESITQFREYLRLAPETTAQNRRNIERARDFIKKLENE